MHVPVFTIDYDRHIKFLFSFEVRIRVVLNATCVVVVCGTSFEMKQAIPKEEKIINDDYTEKKTLPAPLLVPWLK